jgi:hypothetical protein
MKYWKFIIITLGLIPVGFITSLLAFYFHAGQLLGRLPIANMDDPANFPIYSTYHPLINVTGNLWLFSFIAWTIVVGLYLFLQRSNISWRPVFFSAVGQGLAILLFLSKISEWYAD